VLILNRGRMAESHAEADRDRLMKTGRVRLGDPRRRERSRTPCRKSPRRVRILWSGKGDMQTYLVEPKEASICGRKLRGPAPRGAGESMNRI